GGRAGPGGRRRQRRRAARADRPRQPRGRIRPAHRNRRRTAGMKALAIVWKKELKELVRDRKTLLLSVLMGPILAPLLVIGLAKIGESKAQEQMEQALEVAIVGAEHAPNLVAWLDAQGIDRKEVADADAAIRSQSEDVYLRIGEEYAGQWHEGMPVLGEAGVAYTQLCA